MLMGLAIAAKLALYIGALLGIGLSLHRLLGVSDKVNGIIPAAIIVMVACAVKLLISNAQLSGSLGGALSPDTFGWVWQASGNQAICFIVGAITLMVGAIAQWRAILAIGAIMTGAAFALSGHTQSLETPGLMPWFVTLHVLIAAYWITAPISLSPKRQSDDGKLLVSTKRFSQFAIWLIPLLFISGIVLLWKLAGGFTPIFNTLYGRLLLFKLIAALLLLGLGALNKLKVARQLEDNIATGRASLTKTLNAETALFVGVLILITLATTITGPSH